MAMTKKHYEALAYRIAQQARKAANDSAVQSALRDLVDDLCVDFAATNPRFDAWRFVEATGTASFKVIR